MSTSLVMAIVIVALSVTDVVFTLVHLPTWSEDMRTWALHLDAVAFAMCGLCGHWFHDLLLAWLRARVAHIGLLPPDPTGRLVVALWTMVAFQICAMAMHQEAKRIPLEVACLLGFVVAGVLVPSGPRIMTLAVG